MLKVNREPAGIAHACFVAVWMAVLLARPLLVSAEPTAKQQTPPAVAPISAFSIQSIRTDKLLYRPGSNGLVRVEVRNNSTEAGTATIDAEIICELNDHAPLASTKVELAIGKSKLVEIPFAVGNRKFGCEIRLVLRQGPDARPIQTASAYFSVADNFFDVGIGGTTSPIFSDNPAKLKKLLDICRRNYCNWLDVFFWAPCDWARGVSPLDQWWSGQTSYPHVEANLKAFIADGHANGISLAAYASCNPAGPFGWEAARQNPQWFADSAGQLPAIEPGDVEALDRWNDPAWRANHKFSKWLRVPVDLRRLDALDFGINQLAESAKHYGWDAVRFDGHYTIPSSDELSTRNMRRLKETIWKQKPDYRFAFNYGRAPEWRGGVTHEMREAMAGGGMYMQEGIRAWHYTGASYTSWQHYASNELRIAKQIQSLGGSYHCIWGIMKGSPPEQSAYKLIYGLIAGGHPAYGDHMFAPGCDNWGAFLTRWSGFLWDRAIRPLELHEQISANMDSSIWKAFVQERVQSPTRRYLIFHMVNPPPHDEIAKASFPAPLRNIRISVVRQPGEQIGRIMLVRPDHSPSGVELVPEAGDGAVFLSVDEVKLWGMVIVEFTGKYTEPAAPPKFTEPPDEAKVAAAMAGRMGARIIDPSKPAEAEAKPGERIWPTDHGFSGVGAKIEPDDQAINSAAQVQSWDNQQQGNSRRFMGATWLGPLAAGKYRLEYHVKWTDGGNNAAWKAHLYVRSTTSKKKQDLAAAEMASPNCWDQPGDKLDVFLGSNWRQIRRKFGPADAYHYVPLEFELKVASHIHANMIVETDREGPAKFSLDHIQTTLLEPYFDAQQAAWSPVEKPAGLRTPRGDAPAKVLLVKGLFSQFYQVSKAAAADETWQLPAKYEDLYACDAVVLADVDVTSSTFAQRRILRDFVEDGGRLVILGGIATLGQGGMANTWLEEISPVTLKGAREVIAEPIPLLLRFKPGQGQVSAEKPAVFWRHDVSFRLDAQILAYAGDHPIAARRVVGKGQVIVFTGTVLGKAENGVTPFWETQTWIGMLGKWIGGK
jgi:uncharacterized membrane protein